MGFVLNGGSGGLICDRCRTLVATGKAKIKLMVDALFVKKTKKGNRLYFCSESCMKVHGSGSDSPHQKLESRLGELINNPEFS